MNSTYKISVTPRTNTSNVSFVGTLIFSRIPQGANIGCCSGFRKSKWIPQIYVNSAYNLRISFTICGIRLQFAVSTYSCGFRDSLSLLNTYLITPFQSLLKCWWHLLNKPYFQLNNACSNIFFWNREIPIETRSKRPSLKKFLYRQTTFNRIAFGWRRLYSFARLFVNK